MNPYKGGDSACAVKIGKEIIFSGGYADAYDDDGYRIMENTTIYTNGSQPVIWAVGPVNNKVKFSIDQTS